MTSQAPALAGNGGAEGSTQMRVELIAG